MMAKQSNLSAEWLEPNRLGGLASGTVGGRPTRRYHALLLAATNSGRFILVNGFDAWIETTAGTFPTSTQLYSPDVVNPYGTTHLASFDTEPWPRWTFRFQCGTQIEQQLFVARGSATVALSRRVSERRNDVWKGED